MFKVGEKAIYKNLGVYLVDDIETEDFGDGDKKYYVLIPFYKKNSSSKIMLPAASARSLREIPPKEKVLNLIDDFDECDNLWINDSKQRRDEFYDILENGNLRDLVSLLHTIREKRLELKKNKKMLSMMDKEIYEIAEKCVREGICASLELEPKDLDRFIDARISTRAI